MYKTTNDLTSYIERVSSHSTKPRPTGLIEDIPSWAQEPEAYYNSVRDRYKILSEQFNKIQGQLTGINQQLKQTLPHKQFEHLRNLRTALADQASTLQHECSQYRALTRAVSEKSWATTFYCCAKLLLNHDELKKLEQQTMELLGRQRHEISKGEAEHTPEQKEHRKRKQKRQKDRRMLRDKRNTSTLVWSDEKGGMLHPGRYGSQR